MQVIWKFKLRPAPDVNEFELPRGAQVLTVQVQRGEPHMWVLCDPSPTAPKTLRRFVVVGTGHEFELPNFELSNGPVMFNGYVGTFQLEGGALVFHVFEVTGGA